ncbi:S41 family peptidase [Candidatus Saccharibacteria bacterium TM7i]|nr:S41 family peptidase [Candidatus Saccharibacteria bacterium TM7i]
MSNQHDAPYVSPRRAPQIEQRKRGLGLGTFMTCLIVGGLAFAAGALSVRLYPGSTSPLFQGDTLDLSSVQTTYNKLRGSFDGKLDTQELVEGANRGLVEAAGDQYTVFLNAKDSEEFNNSLTGNIGGGIGVEVGMRSGVPVVERLLQDNPAEKAGVMVGDAIIEVNGESTEKKSLNDVVGKIRGEAGTTVKLTLARGGERVEASVTRQQVNNPSAYGTIKDGVGVLTVSRFDDSTGSLARKVARDFKDAGVTGVVLDLRGNGGGYVTAAKEVAGIWLNDKVVVSERKGGKTVEELRTGSDAILGGVKTVVLVNQSSASASEIVAGALRDHKAASLVGETTFGKGSVQQLIQLPNDATLKVTVARWYTPNGLNISEKGITPDVSVKRTAEDANAGRDPQLDAALSKLR